MKGEFESRLKALLEEAAHSPQPVILFVDEVHTLVGAGGTSGTGDAANLLKPRWRVAPCAPSAQPPGASTNAISKRIRR